MISFIIKYAMICVVTLCCLSVQASAQTLPPLPDFYLGINQFGTPSPFTDAELIRLKSDTGMNCIRFPLYPEHLGLNGKLVAGWEDGQAWDETVANSWPVNWENLDKDLDQMVRLQLTPIINPCPEPPRTWETLHIPEAAERAFWFTKLVVTHLHNKYGDNVVYGWYENMVRLCYMHEKSARFPSAFRSKLRDMYGSITSLNSAWKSSYSSFDDVPVPQMWDGKNVPDDAISSRRTYDLRRAMDLITRDQLAAWRTELSQIAPGAKWAGGCLHDGFSGLYDVRTLKPPCTTASVLTHAITSDFISADNYLLPNILKIDYRTIAKIASTKGKKYMASEVLSWSAPSYEGIAEVGGPLQGVTIWEGRDDMWGLLTSDGTRREASIAALAKLFNTIRSNPAKYQTYAPGNVRVLFPQDTYEYMLTSTSYLDCYEHVCDAMPPTALEPVLESELLSLPDDAYLFVLEQNLLRTTINALNRLGPRLVCPHSYFIDEDGNRINRTWMPANFNTQLASVPNGPLLTEAFKRVSEKRRNCASAYIGAIARTSSLLAPGLGELGAGYADRNIIWNVIDGNHSSEVRFADVNQPEQIELEFRDEKLVDGVYVQFFPGDVVGFGRSIPQRIKVTVSADGVNWTELANTTNIPGDRWRLSFNPMTISRARFDFGSNMDGKGTRVFEVGVLEHMNSTQVSGGSNGTKAYRHAASCRDCDSCDDPLRSDVRSGQDSLWFWCNPASGWKLYGCDDQSGKALRGASWWHRLDYRHHSE